MFKIADNHVFGRFLLQLFAEDTGANLGGDSAAAATVAAPESDPAPSAPSQPQSLAEFFQSRMAGENQEPPQTNEPPAQADNGEPEPPAPDAAKPEPPEPRVDIPDKFKNPDGSVNMEALIKSYTDMESTYSRASQVEQFTKLQQTVIDLQQQIARQQQAQTQTSHPPQAPQPTKEELEAQAKAEADKFWEDYNEDPRTAITKLVQDTVKNAVKSEVEPSVSQLAQKVEPIIQNAEYQSRVEEYHTQVMEAKKDRPDFDEMLPEMRKVIDEFGDVLKSRPDAVVAAYNLAKARQAGIQQPAKPAATEPVKPPTPPTIEDLMTDQEMVATLAQDPALKNLIIAQHLQDVKNNPAPPVIGSHPGGISPSSQPVDLKDMKTAKEALKAKYAGFNLQ